MDFEELHRRLVAEALRELRRPHDVGEEHGANSRVAMVFGAARDDGSAGAVDVGPAEESLGDLGSDFDDLRRDEAVGLAMHAVRRFGIRRAAEAEDLARSSR